MRRFKYFLCGRTRYEGYVRRLHRQPVMLTREEAGILRDSGLSDVVSVEADAKLRRLGR